MASSGHQCINVRHEALKSDEKFILVVEGAVPLKDDDLYCTIGEDEQGKPITFLKWVKDLGKKALYVVALGTCATWGGIPAAELNPTDANLLQR
jgi:Ni,Fe-hydrogenase I small subunit